MEIKGIEGGSPPGLFPVRKPCSEQYGPEDLDDLALDLHPTLAHEKGSEQTARFTALGERSEEKNKARMYLR